MLNSRALGFLCGILIAFFTTFFVSLLPDVDESTLWVSSIMSFATSYILVWLLTEFLFFREIDNIHRAMQGLSDSKLSTFLEKGKSTSNPFRKINREIRDYADVKQQEIDKLKQMEEFRREFIADISHELKTPLFSAQGFVHTLLDGAIDDKRVRRKFLKKAAKSLDGLDILVQDLLTLSQVESGQIKMRKDNFDMVYLVREVVDQLEEKAEDKQIPVSVINEHEHMYVYADYRRIYQVVTNLISNSLKYTKKGGKIWVLVEELPNEIMVGVKDSGRGIPEEDVSRIFERFYRVEKSRSKTRGGTGLGLAIVKHILEAHGSSIQVASEYGVGSKFWFHLQKGIPADPPVWDEDESDEDLEEVDVS